MRELLNIARKEMSGSQHSDLTKKYSLVSNLIDNIAKKLDGIGKLRGMNIVHLCSLVGLIPRDYYVHAPLHLSGGPGIYLCNFHGLEVSNQKEIIRWSINENRKLVEHFTPEFTGNMHENAACIIGRAKVRKDLFFIYLGLKRSQANL